MHTIILCIYGFLPVQYPSAIQIAASRLPGSDRALLAGEIKCEMIPVWNACYMFTCWYSVTLCFYGWDMFVKYVFAYILQIKFACFLFCFSKKWLEWYPLCIKTMKSSTTFHEKKSLMERLFTQHWLAVQTHNALQATLTDSYWPVPGKTLKSWPVCLPSVAAASKALSLEEVAFSNYLLPER